MCFESQKLLESLSVGGGEAVDSYLLTGVGWGGEDLSGTVFTSLSVHRSFSLALVVHRSECDWLV